MKSLARRYPLLFSLILVGVLFGLTYLSRELYPSEPVGDIRALAPEQLAPPSALDQALGAIRNAETLFWGLTILLCAGLLSWLGWWREAGFGGPSRWRNLRLLWLPGVAIAISLSGGVYLSSAGYLASVLIGTTAATVGQEILFRGLLWRAFVPRGPLVATALTALLSGALVLGRAATDGPFPEAVYLAATAACGGVAYGALRWRTASLWPVLIVHLALELSTDLGSLSSTVYPVLLRLTTLGFLAFGLFLLRDERARADGG